MKKILIITGDDFGYAEERDRGILEGFNKHGITRVSLLVNGISASSACHLAEQYHIPIGLHMNLTEGKPETVADKIPSLVNSDGVFHGKHGFRIALQQCQINFDELELEMTSQIERFKSLMKGKLPLHVDGHQHVHILPGVCSLFAKVLSKYHIESTRLPLEKALSNCHWMSAELRQFYETVSQQSQIAKSCFTRHGLRFPDSFVGLATMGSFMTVERLQSKIMEGFEFAIDSKNGSVVADTVVSCELMVHPGYRCGGTGGCGDPAGPDDFSRSPDREVELRVLTSDAMRQFYETHDIQLSADTVLKC